MTKNQKIKRLEETIEMLGRLMGFSISFPNYKFKTSDNISYKKCPIPILGWHDPKIQALLKHLGISHIVEKDQPPREYKVILIPKKPLGIKIK